MFILEWTNLFELVSLYSIFFSFVALFWIFSISLILPSLNGHQTEFADSTCGRTIAGYGQWTH